MKFIRYMRLPHHLGTRLLHLLPKSSMQQVWNQINLRLMFPHTHHHTLLLRRKRCHRGQSPVYRINSKPSLCSSNLSRLRSLSRLNSKCSINRGLFSYPCPLKIDPTNVISALHLLLTQRNSQNIKRNTVVMVHLLVKTVILLLCTKAISVVTKQDARRSVQ